jgi:hypothetical protein
VVGQWKEQDKYRLLVLLGFTFWEWSNSGCRPKGGTQISLFKKFSLFLELYEYFSVFQPILSVGDKGVLPNIFLQFASQ